MNVSPAHRMALPPTALPPTALPPTARIVVMRFGSLGDVVKCTALPRLVKSAYPQSQLTFVTSDSYLELISGDPHIDRPLGLDRKLGWAGLTRLARDLREHGVDLAVDVHRSLRSRLLCGRLEAPVAAYSKRTLQRWLLIRFGVNTYNPPAGKEQDFLLPLAPYGVRDDGLGTRLYFEGIAADFPARLAGVLATLARWRQEGRPILGIAPVAAWALKCWPLASFDALVAGFLARTRGAVVVFGGPGDRDAHALAQRHGARALSVVGRTSYLESAYIASLTDLVVANDTGMVHLAEAAGRDVIALYGPTSRELGYYPARPGSLAVERDLPCRPCTRMGEGRCTHPLERACLVGIAPGHVLALALGKLGLGPEAGALGSGLRGAGLRGAGPLGAGPC
jgi:ADP-heptose:LPS heptosyltransferase